MTTHLAQTYEHVLFILGKLNTVYKFDLFVAKTTKFKVVFGVWLTINELRDHDPDLSAAFYLSELCVISPFTHIISLVCFAQFYNTHLHCEDDLCRALRFYLVLPSAGFIQYIRTVAAKRERKFLEHLPPGENYNYMYSHYCN